MKNKTKRFLFFISIFLLALGNIHSQSKDWDKLSFAELEALQLELYRADDMRTLRKLCKYYIQRGKSVHDRIEQAKGRTLLTVIESPQIGLAHADTIIAITEGLDHPDYPAWGYFLKAGIHYDEGSYREALKYYGIAYDLALAKGNRNQQRDITMNVAAIRNINGQPRTAADLYRRALELLREEPNFEEEHRDDHFRLLYNLSLAHMRLQQWDSSAVYVNQGLGLARRIEDNSSVQDFSVVRAHLDYYTGNLAAAHDTLMRYMDDLELESQAISMYYLGKIAEGQEKKEASIRYYERVDSLLDVSEQPFPEVKEVYGKLITEAADKQQLERQRDYIEKLIRYDSILSLERQGVQDQVALAYDIPLLKAQRDAVIRDLEARKLWTRGLLVLLVAAILSLIVLFIRNRTIKRRVNELIDRPVQTVQVSKKGKKKLVPENIASHIRKGLESFEHEHAYVDQSIKLETLAKQLDTNPGYLSNFVNQEKGMSFPTYLKALRVDNAVEQLKANPGLLVYGYLGLAKEFGFGSGEGFARAFRERTGVSPSNFLKELKARKKTDDS